MAISITEAPLYLVDFDSLSILTYSSKVSSAYEKEVDSSGQVLERNRKGLLMFKEKFVSDIRFTEPVADATNAHFIITGKIKAEMKKRTQYFVEAKIKPDNEILSLSCQCPAGVNPAFCKHSYALLYALEDYSRKELYRASTERLQTWHQPRPNKVSPKKGRELFGKPAANNEHANSFNWDVLSIDSPLLNVLANANDVLYIKTIPLPAVSFSGTLYEGLPEELPMLEALFLHKNLKFNVDDIQNLEKCTVGQGNNNTLWCKERKLRLTASDYGTILRRRSGFDELAKQLIIKKSVNLSHIPAVFHGLKHEGYVRNIIKQMNPNFIFRETGLVSHPIYPYLGASPDGLLYNSDVCELLEIKCIFNPKGLPLKELVKRKDFCLEENGESFDLKKNHNYYAQVQGQMGLSNIDKCRFVMYVKQGEPLCEKTVPFDKDFFLNMANRLKAFYFQNYLKFLM